MKLQTASRLALYAVLELADHPGRQISAGEISRKYGISAHHLAKVLHTLGRAGHVRAVRGASGGYIYAGNVKRTTLHDIVELFESLDDPYAKSEPGADTPVGAALDEVLDETNAIIRATFNSITLATTLKQMTAAAPKAAQSDEPPTADAGGVT